MLNDLRRILEEDNRIESDLELMMEGTDADMVEMFIDEDGEAEIPESELTKILTKIPEYNQEEELNKKLKRLTESVIPDYEILEEKSTLKDKILRFRDDVRDEEFCEAMEAEYDEYLNIISEQDDGFDDDFDDDFFLEESKSEKMGFIEKSYREAAAKIKTVSEAETVLKRNTQMYKEMTTAMEAKLKEADENKVKSVLKDLKSYVVLGIPIIGTKLALNPGEKSPKAVLAHAIKNNRLCDKVIRERIKELKSGKKGVKESYVLDLTDEPDYIV